MFRFRFCFLIAWLFLFSSCVPNKYPRVLSGIELAAGSLVMADSSLTGAEAAGLVDPQVAARLRADGTEVFNALSEGLAVVNQAAADAEARDEWIKTTFFFLKELSRTEKMILNHIPRQAGKAVQQRIDALKVGQKMQDLPEHLWHESFRYYVKEDPTRAGGPNLRLIRLDPDSQSLTVTAYIFNKFVHPAENRFITPREAARLQGFPDDLVFVGTLTSTQQQVGNAVPVELGRAVLTEILHTAKKEYPRRKNFAALSLFSGAGGLDIGANSAEVRGGARWKTAACVDNDHDSCETLRGYFGKSLRVFEAEISTLDPSDVLKESRVRREDLTLIQGGPPCQAFSQAGKQKGTMDSRGQLIKEFLRFVESLMPSYFLMENVSGLRGIDKGRLLVDILDTMEKIGYNVELGLLDATHFGSAQRRRRLIFVGSRHGLEKACLPSPTHCEPGNVLGLKPYKTVGSVLAGLPPAAERLAGGNF